MKSIHRFVSAIGLVVLFVQGVLANECYNSDDPNHSSSAASISVNNQTDADRLLGNCTTVRGQLYIGASYTGALNISTITNITGDIYVQSTRLTSLTLDNLLYVDDLQINNYGNLTALSLNGLVQATKIWVTSKTPMSISIPSLVNAEVIKLYGNYSSIDFSHLENANISMNSAGFYTDRFSPIDLTFPSLKTSNTFEMYGNITNISLPKFRTAGTIGISSRCSLNLAFPSLMSTDKMSVFNVANLSVPTLYAVQDLRVTASTPTKLSFPALTNGSRIDITGNVTNILLPALLYCPTLLSIYSDTKIDCTSANAAIAHVRDQQKASSTSTSSSSSPYFTCMQRTVWDEDAFERNHRMSMFLGFGLGFGIPLAIIASCMIWVFWKRYTYKRDNGLLKGRGSGSGDGGASAYKREQRRIAKERERAAKLTQKLAVLDARRVAREEALKKKIVVVGRKEEAGEAEADLGVFKLEERVKPQSQAVAYPPAPAWTSAGDPDDVNAHDSDDPPPSYEWEGSSSRFGWEARGEMGEGSGSGAGAGAESRSGGRRGSSRWRDGGGQFTEEETELLKGSRSG